MVNYNNYYSFKYSQNQLNCFDLLIYFLVSCSDDKTLRIWQCYEPGNQEGML